VVEQIESEGLYLEEGGRILEEGGRRKEEGEMILRYKI
jgi:hypothetical protein